MEVDNEALKEAMRKLIMTKGLATARSILAKHGESKPGAVSAEKRPAVYADVMKELG